MEGACTRAFYPPLPVVTRATHEADPAGHGRRIYSIEGENLPEALSFSLVVAPENAGPHRLVVAEGRDRRRAITLEPLP